VQIYRSAKWNMYRNDITYTSARCYFPSVTDKYTFSADHSTTRRHKTRCMQIRCNSCMYSQTFPSAVRLWNCVPPDTCYLALESFKLELSKINLIWSRTKFLSHRTAWFYFLKMGFLSTWPAPAARYYSTTELALVSEDEQENPAAFKAQLSRCAPVRMPWPTTTISVILHEEDCW